VEDPFALEAFQLLKDLAADSPRVVSQGRAAIGRAVKDRQRAETKRVTNKRAHSAALALPGGPWTPHDLRRTAATLMAENGVQPHIIERCLNHIQPTLVRTYQRADYADEQAAAFLVLGERLTKVAPRLFATLRKECGL
jgi:integrase